MARPVALVTAASQGIGAACARALAADGYRVVLLARSAEVEALADELGGLAVRGDVTQDGDLKRLVDEAVAAYGRIDAVVVNSGHAARGPLLDLSDDDWQTGMDLLLMSVIRLARYATPVMQAQDGGGSFVTISTLAALEPNLDFPISSVMRAGLAAFTRLFATQYAAEGLRMNSVLPGFVDSYPVDEATRAAIPAGRPGTVEEIAEVVAFLASPAARYVTGQNLPVDGGLGRGL